MKEDIYLTYKDLQFLLNISRFEAKRMVFTALPKNDREEVDQISDIKVKHSVDYRMFDLKIKSFSEALDGKKYIEYIVETIRNNGLSENKKIEILNDNKNLKKGQLTGISKSCAKLLSKSQLLDLCSRLKRRSKEKYPTIENI